MLFQPVTRRASLVVFFLILDVIDHPLQIFRAKRNDAVTALPFQAFWLNFVINVVGTRTFQFSDPIRNEDVRLQASPDMNMGFDAANRVKSRSRRFENLMSQIVVKSFFDPFSYHRQTGFCVPGDVEVYL